MVFVDNTYYLSRHRSVDVVGMAQAVRLPHLPHKSVIVDKPQTPVASYHDPDLRSQALGAFAVGAVARAVAEAELAVVAAGLGLAGGVVRVQHEKFGG